MFKLAPRRFLSSSKIYLNAQTATSVIPEKKKGVMGIIERVAERHFPDAEDPLRVELHDPVNKFRILCELMDATDRNISDVELNNIHTLSDAAEVLTRPEIDVLAARKTKVEDVLKKMELPDNMHWVPSKKTLIDQMEAQGINVRETKE